MAGHGPLDVVPTMILVVRLRATTVVTLARNLTYHSAVRYRNTVVSPTASDVPNPQVSWLVNQAFGVEVDQIVFIQLSEPLL